MPSEPEPPAIRPRARFSLQARARSFVFAFRGLRELVQGEHNAWIHALAAMVAIAAGAIWRISRVEWCLVLLCIGAVFAMEACNTALESLADALHPEPHPLVGRAKDLAAAAVLIVSIATAIVGLLVFGPHLWVTWRSWTAPR